MNDTKEDLNSEIRLCEKMIDQYTGDAFLQYGWIKRKEEAQNKLKKLEEKKP